uniref:Uncharacterized protein n=1 Tax=Caenorhabditis tropicalis TaxID=1561998 RepID=A0A1I7TGK2_9PELO
MMCQKECLRMRDERIARCKARKMAYMLWEDELCWDCQEEKKMREEEKERQWREKMREEAVRRARRPEWQKSLTDSGNPFQCTIPNPLFQSHCFLPTRSKEKYERMFNKVRGRFPEITMEEVRTEALARMNRTEIEKIKMKLWEKKEEELRQLRAAYGKRDPVQNKRVSEREVSRLRRPDQK